MHPLVNSKCIAFPLQVYVNIVDVCLKSDRKPYSFAGHAILRGCNYAQSSLFNQIWSALSHELSTFFIRAEMGSLGFSLHPYIFLTHCYCTENVLKCDTVITTQVKL